MAEIIHGSTALNQPKLSAKHINDYAKYMEHNPRRKVDFFSTSIRNYILTDKTLLSRSNIIIDVGCCTGKVMLKLDEQYDDTLKIMGYDLSPQFVNRVKTSNPQAMVFVGDGFQLPIRNDTIAVFILSGVFHEFYSYYCNGFDMTGLVVALAEMKRTLVEGGYIIITDPVGPENKNELLTGQLKDLNVRISEHTSGIGIDIRRRLETLDITQLSKNDIDFLRSVNPPNLLSRNARIARFISEFLPARAEFSDGIVSINQEGRFSMTAKLWSELARHLSLGDTVAHWNSEVNEVYGPLSISEMVNFMSKMGFEVVSLETKFKEDNHANWFKEELILYNSQGQEIRQSDRFPTDQNIVFKSACKLYI